jgi:hypothetical protein
MLREFELHYAGLELQAQMVSSERSCRNSIGSRKLTCTYSSSIPSRSSQAKIIAGRPIVKDQADVGSQLPIGLTFRNKDKSG